mmetsp:Transcript_623/g.1480  ORF Transcript_623/g.1480 Transcript_623/m.1480 type:complete len:229 (-) Transcript_623:581-1267(-)
MWSPISQQLYYFWDNHYNDETQWWSFFLPMSFWTACWVRTKFITKSDFSRWWELHTFHHVIAITFASLSLYYNDDSIFNERNGILWSMSYFIIDIIECLSEGHILYVGHGLACVILGLANYNLPLHRSLRMNSKASYIETSSIVMYQVKRKREAWLFAIFAIVYTICRIIWIPIMAKDLLDNGMDLTHPVIMVLCLFYCLNIHWYIKIVKIAMEGDGRKDWKNEAKRK